MYRESKAMPSAIFIFLWLFVGTLETGYAQTVTVECGKGTSSVPTIPGACPPPLTWDQGNAPPPGAIQVNPTAQLPANAICEYPSNNACSQSGYACSPGKICKDTWNASTKACMCKCL